MNKEILSHEVQDFLKSHFKESSREVALKKSPFANVSSSELANQLESLQKSEKKLPLWFHTPGIYFPPSLSIEQASSEETALYKATLISENTSLVDLTGGIGIDSYYFSKRAKKVLHCELNPDLSEIAKHNAEVLGAKNIEFHAGDGLKVLEEQSTETFQTIYLDPSRRVKTRKVFMLQDCEPNIIEIQKDLLEKAPIVIIKAAPLLDITLSLTKLLNTKEVHIISLKNECKEVLFILERDFTSEPIIKVVGLGKDFNFEFQFHQQEEKNAIADYSLPKNYLFDPDVALLKAGCFKLLSERYAIQKIHPNTHLYTSENNLKDFPGRRFKINETFEYKEFKKKKIDWSATIISRNFPLSVADLRKKHRVMESSTKYLFFCKGLDEKLYVVHADRLA